jgi:hypothetical protein
MKFTTTTGTVELRVYGIDIIDLPDSFNVDCEDDLFIETAEHQGLVWSLEGFQEAFNNDTVDITAIFIRFIAKESY